MTLENVWRRKSDEELITASRRLTDYSAEGQSAIAAELDRRRTSGLLQDNTSTGDDSENLESEAATDPPPANYLLRLWRGHVRLPVTYWLWGVALHYGSILAAAFASALEFQAVALLLLLMFVIHAVLISVAIWRSAGMYRGNRIWAELARISIAAGAANVAMRLAF